MLFTNISFIYYFLPIVIIAYFIVPKKLKNVVLLLASMIFYFYGEPKYTFLMVAEILVAYIGGILIGKNKNKTYWIIFEIKKIFSDIYYFHPSANFGLCSSFSSSLRCKS